MTLRDWFVFTPVIAALVTWGAYIAVQRIRWMIALRRSTPSILQQFEAAVAGSQAFPPGVMYNRVQGQQSLYADACTIPDHAKSAKWERVHLFSPYSKLPTREFFGINCAEPPLALQCPECDLKQPALQGGRRSCPYCGCVMHVHGTRIYWWTPEVAVEASEWTGGAS